MSWFTFERRWLLTLFDAVLPGGAHPAFPRTVEEAGVDRFVTDLVQHAPPPANLGLRVATWALTFAPLWRWGRPRTMGRLERDEQVQLFEALHRSRLHLVRELPMLVKTFAVMGYGSLADVQRNVGVPLPAGDRVSWEPPAAQRPEAT